MQVIKRSGVSQNFDIDRIINAIKLAMYETDNGIDTQLISKISKQIENEIRNKDINNDVENIQDRIEVLLMEFNRHDVAKKYIIYIRYKI